ncbi:hypothetical protein GCM10010372_21660 [Streptomyces tauricus]|uniref:DUF4232 domain-containing protein n=1 Tax=Streptomyces tauricus TaxID=68274 RepID=UPI001675F835|nr:DUF4232 domain-containing protein [Streptomyces tauricus]GHA21358.1 hypothetical protein GCM10010372_21660 [Streptomyces tauricus]
MSGIRRKAFLVSAVVVGSALLMTACQETDDKAKDSRSGSSSSSAGKADGGATPSGSSSTGGGQAAGKGTGSDASKGTGNTDGSGVDTGDGTREKVEQGCGANDITWSTRSESQAGGYILIMAKAKSGISCYLPAELPTVAFGSDGTEAGPAEQSVGEQIKLSGSTVAYAGVNPKTTDTDGGKELENIIVAVGNEDPNPVTLPVDTITVDKPIVTNWHTSPTDAVPFS